MVQELHAQEPDQCHNETSHNNNLVQSYWQVVRSLHMIVCRRCRSSRPPVMVERGNQFLVCRVCLCWSDLRRVRDLILCLLACTTQLQYCHSRSELIRLFFGRQSSV
jgi:hypothetical protein